MRAAKIGGNGADKIAMASGMSKASCSGYPKANCPSLGRKARWSTIHLVRQANSDRIWMFNERGELLIAKLSPEGLSILDRCQLIEPTKPQLPQRGGVCWSHPAFAERSVFIRNDNCLVRASLKAE